MKHKHIISTVHPGSIAEEMGIEPGDRLLTMNGNEIEDIFDYRYYMEDELVVLLIEKENGEQWELEIEKEEFEDQVELYFHGHENINEKTQKEITEKTENLIEHLDEIDEQISAHTNAWNLERLGKAELSILRLATYEILLDEQVPRKVAINEAVELAKKYCNEKAAPFINGVLSKIGQDMDEE